MAVGIFQNSDKGKLSLDACTLGLVGCVFEVHSHFHL